MTRARHLLLAAAVVAAVAGAQLSMPAAGASEPVNGGGSTWSAVAIQAWQADVARQGLTVNYQPTGSTAGRQGYTAATYDFAVSEIPFQPQYCTNPADPSTCYDEQTQPGLLARPFAYMPIVAGGTSLLYNLQVNGQQFTKLQLTPATVTKIFTGVISNWNDPAIAVENPGVSFPDLKIQPVVRSDGAGTSYQFTAFMAFADPADWNAFCAKAGIAQNPCPPTSQYPYGSLPNSAPEDGSDGVANWVAAPYNNGSIGYAEAAYGINRGVPLASLQNASGVYVQPTAKAVAVALTRAVINPDHSQNLQGVYTNPDPRAYPMSSYSYMIVPTTDAAPMDLSKGATLSRFILYFLCQGQQEAAPLGYSPLPPNLVELGFSVEQQIPGAAAPPPLNSCNNPTITGGFLNDIGSPSGPGVGGHGGPVSGPAPGTQSTVRGPTGPASGTAFGPTASSSATGGLSRSAGTGGRGGTTSTLGAGPAAATGDTVGTLGDNGPSSALLASAPQAFGRHFRATSILTAVVVILVLALALLTPPVLALRRRRAD
jgi:phosphate transport system substrate-binding protein